MKDIFKINNYREIISMKIKEMPNGGRGQMSEISRYIGVHTTYISQVLKEVKELSLDQMTLVCDYFSFNELETDYALTLLNFNRAGHFKTKKIFEKKLQALRKDALKIKKHIRTDKELNDSEKAIFYSSWQYTSIRQITALPNINTAKDIAQYLSLPIAEVIEKITFLIKVGLLEEKRGKLSTGISSTHLDANSPLVNTHHKNWRIKAIESFDQPRENDLHYSSPMTLSEEDANEIRKILLKSVTNVKGIVDPSPSEKHYCINIDWFEL